MLIGDCFGSLLLGGSWGLTILCRGCLKTIKLPKYKLTVIGKKLEIARITQPPTPNPEPRCLSIQTASCKEGLREVYFYTAVYRNPPAPFTKGGLKQHKF